jgi:hypothetical protein
MLPDLLPDIIIEESSPSRVPTEMVGKTMTSRTRVANRFVSGTIDGKHAIQNYLPDGVTYRIDWA